MNYEEVKKLNPPEFKLYCGVHIETFNDMVKVVKAEIICTAFVKGKIHDFNLLKKSKINFNEETKCLADKGYQGINKIHKNSSIPIKKRKKKKLSIEEKKFNRQLARERIIVEHIHRHLKIFKILSSRYRNRRKRFGLRFNLIAGIYNYELSLKTKLAIA